MEINHQTLSVSVIDSEIAWKSIIKHCLCVCALHERGSAYRPLAQLLRDKVDERRGLLQEATDAGRLDAQTRWLALHLVDEEADFGDVSHLSLQLNMLGVFRPLNSSTTVPHELTPPTLVDAMLRDGRVQFLKLLQRQKSKRRRSDADSEANSPRKRAKVDVPDDDISETGTETSRAPSVPAIPNTDAMDIDPPPEPDWDGVLTRVNLGSDLENTRLSTPGQVKRARSPSAQDADGEPNAKKRRLNPDADGGDEDGKADNDAVDADHAISMDGDEDGKADHGAVDEDNDTPMDGLCVCVCVCVCV